MNCFGILTMINLVVFSIIFVQLTSSASFPNPPQKPPSNASPDEQALFWKLLHNYYAIIARPRFGKRFDPTISRSKHPSIVTIIDSDLLPSSSSEYDMNYLLNENIRNVNDQRINDDNLYTFAHPDRRRRRRR